MDTLNDHAARISARIEEYRTLDLIGRNSADDLQHHLRALVAERDEANARAERLRSFAQMVEENLPIVHWRKAHDQYLQHGDLDAAPSDTN